MDLDCWINPLVNKSLCNYLGYTRHGLQWTDDRSNLRFRGPNPEKARLVEWMGEDDGPVLAILRDSRTTIQAIFSRDFLEGLPAERQQHFDMMQKLNTQCLLDLLEFELVLEYARGPSSDAVLIFVQAFSITSTPGANIDHDQSYTTTFIGEDPPIAQLMKLIYARVSENTIDFERENGMERENVEIEKGLEPKCGLGTAHELNTGALDGGYSDSEDSVKSQIFNPATMDSGQLATGPHSQEVFATQVQSFRPETLQPQPMGTINLGSEPISALSRQALMAQLQSRFKPGNVEQALETGPESQVTSFPARGAESLGCLQSLPTLNNAKGSQEAGSEIRNTSRPRSRDELLGCFGSSSTPNNVIQAKKCDSEPRNSFTPACRDELLSLLRHVPTSSRVEQAQQTHHETQTSLTPACENGCPEPLQPSFNTDNVERDRQDETEIQTASQIGLSGDSISGSSDTRQVLTSRNVNEGYIDTVLKDAVSKETLQLQELPRSGALSPTKVSNSLVVNSSSHDLPSRASSEEVFLTKRPPSPSTPLAILDEETREKCSLVQTVSLADTANESQDFSVRPSEVPCDAEEETDVANLTVSGHSLKRQKENPAPRAKNLDILDPWEGMTRIHRRDITISKDQMKILESPGCWVPPETGKPGPQWHVPPKLLEEWNERISRTDPTPVVSEHDQVAESEPDLPTTSSPVCSDSELDSEKHFPWSSSPERGLRRDLPPDTSPLRQHESLRRVDHARLDILALTHVYGIAVEVPPPATTFADKLHSQLSDDITEDGESDNRNDSSTSEYDPKRDEPESSGSDSESDLDISVPCALEAAVQEDIASQEMGSSRQYISTSTAPRVQVVDTSAVGLKNQRLRTSINPFSTEGSIPESVCRATVQEDPASQELTSSGQSFKPPKIQVIETPTADLERLRSKMGAGPILTQGSTIGQNSSASTKASSQSRIENSYDSYGRAVRASHDHSTQTQTSSGGATQNNDNLHNSLISGQGFSASELSIPSAQLPIAGTPDHTTNFIGSAHDCLTSQLPSLSQLGFQSQVSTGTPVDSNNFTQEKTGMDLDATSVSPLKRPASDTDIDGQTSPKRLRPAPKQETSRDEIGIPNRHLSENPFDMNLDKAHQIYNKFKRDYPVYRSSFTHFMRMCAKLQMLRQRGMMQRSYLWDDFVIQHSIGYGSYLQERLAAVEEPQQYESYFLERFTKPTYKRRSLTMSGIDTVASKCPTPVTGGSVAPSVVNPSFTGSLVDKLVGLHTYSSPVARNDVEATDEASDNRGSDGDDIDGQESDAEHHETASIELGDDLPVANEVDEIDQAAGNDRDIQIKQESDEEDGSVESESTDSESGSASASEADSQSQSQSQSEYIFKTRDRGLDEIPLGPRPRSSGFQWSDSPNTPFKTWARADQNVLTERRRRGGAAIPTDENGVIKPTIYPLIRRDGRTSPFG